MAMAADGTVAGDMKKGQLNGLSIQKQAEGREEHQTRPTSFARWSLAVALRLAIWYALLTPLLYCPSTLPELDTTSPTVCKPYLVARSHLEPHITRYYETHGAPYVDTVRPYARNFNEKIYTPATDFTKRNYRAYGAPHIEKAASYIQHKWGEIVTPHIHSLQNALSRTYQSSIEPHYARVTSVVTPYYNAAASQVDYVRQTYIAPVYGQAKPIIVSTYSYTYDIVVNTIYPYSKKTWSYLATFINETLLPGAARLYHENVEPQLLRIGEKLASYREGRKLGAVGEETEILSESFSSTSTISAPATTVSPKTSDHSSSTTATSTSASAPNPEQSADKASLARETIASDLKTWQEKFATAADKGAEDLDERVAKIVESYVNDAQGSAEALVSKLETVGHQELESLRTKIIDIVRDLPDESTFEDRQAAEDQLVQAVRASGSAIREAAQKLRQWLADFNSDLHVEVTSASDATIEVLDQIRDLSLQNIGIKWAWMDGVTYNDWAKYNALKKQLHSWREEVRAVGMQHGVYEEAKALGIDIVNKGMRIAEKTAKELTRLKEVGKWKIEAEDISDDFETRTSDAAEARASKRAAMSVDEPETEPDTGYQSTLSPEDNPDETSTFDEDPSIDADPAISDVDVTPEPSDDQGTSEASASGNEQDVPSSVIFTNSIPTHETKPEPEPNPEPESEPVVDGEDTATGPKVWGGAAAEFIEHENQVPANTPEQTFDDTPSSSQQPSVSSNFAPSETVLSDQSFIPMPPPEASSIFSDSLSQAKKLYELSHSAASAQDFGTPNEGIIASIESAYSGSLQHASEKLESRLKAASEYAGIPLGTSSTATVNDDILASASAKLQDNLEHASLSLASAIASVTDEAALPGQQIILDARRRYYEAIGLAHDEYSLFINSASSHGQPAEETSVSAPIDDKPSKPILEAANSEFSVVSSLASASLDAVLYSVSSVGTALAPASATKIIEDASSRFHDALSAATASLESVLSAASTIASSPTGTAAHATARDEL
ncbi:hypothetical protein GX51_01008 [Blastomyces parvus]|uniref:Transcription factor hoxa13 n=1 Tax=Blastomyces parvus TaxID=2060905 RepID=A0A2B7XJH8_9EURO|nr:hypothetical protein GX51_01008 [Blastomyces parvus]